jgi:hypothetical protein
MVQDPITEDDLNELNIARKKIEIVLNCLVGNANAHDQTLTYIASDYLVIMGDMIQAMQERKMQALRC